MFCNIMQTNNSGSSDPLFTDPYIDIDEWRDEPVRHRYVHGGIKDTQARFSFYFPPKEQYDGRFFQYIMPIYTGCIVLSRIEDKTPLRGMLNIF